MSQIHFHSKNPVFFIAEIGGNHEGDYGYAQKLTDLAIESGADAVKFQFYTGDTLVSRIESEQRNKHFKKFELSDEQNLNLLKKVEKSGAIPMASVWDKQMFAWANPYLPFHKVGSGDLTCYPMLSLLASTGKPIILSTGLSSMKEVEEAVEYIRDIDSKYISERKLALLQCTSAYPTPDEDANLNAMIALKENFDLPVGYSDHTIGSLAVEMAVALGAEIIEKHFTDTRENKEFRDHKISLTCLEVRQLFEQLSRINKLKGQSDKFLTPSEHEADHHISFRRSVYAAVDIAEGDTFDENNLTVLRPAHGIIASRFNEVIGKKAKHSFKIHEAILETDI